MPGPRGLIRLYAPFLDQNNYEIMNYLALEPIVKGDYKRGLSELEMSELDHKRGKRFWSANDSLANDPKEKPTPARGKIETIDGEETLTLFVFSEKFENGAQVYIRLRFYEKNPYELEIKTYAVPESGNLENFIVTATMDNYARLRDLHLKDNKFSSLNLWPDYNKNEFTDHAHFPVKDFIHNQNDQAYFIASPNEDDPEKAEYTENTASHWKYKGKKAVQYWRISDYDENLEGLVNGRYVYWGSKNPIPGGISFENFEIKSPFKKGVAFTFGISPLKPKSFINKIKN